MKRCSFRGCMDIGTEKKPHGIFACWYCQKHHRFIQMRTDAKTHCKKVPSYKLLEQLLGHIENMRCPHCKRRMNWLRKESKFVITIQHDRSGRLRLLCMECNLAHSLCPGDTFYDIPLNKKWCSSCETVKSKKRFQKGGRCLKCKAGTQQIRVDRKLMNKLERIAPAHLSGARERQVAWAIARVLRHKLLENNRRA